MNKLTPGGNLIWESSRIILPEHREALQQLRQKRHERPRPALDEQEQARIAETISTAYQHKLPVHVRVYDPYEHRSAVGLVERIDQRAQRLRIAGEWIAFADVLDAE